MEIKHAEIEGLIVFSPKKFYDERGCFFESFNQKDFTKIVGRDVRFVQDNESVSRLNVIRGLHFQEPPFAQGKLVRVVSGSVLDVAVDLRKDSLTFGKWHSELLSRENGKIFWIPEGFAHGFVALEENTRFLYKCSNFYAPKYEKTIRWNDSFLNINWGVEHPIISQKDGEGMDFNNYCSLF